MQPWDSGVPVQPIYRQVTADIWVKADTNSIRLKRAVNIDKMNWCRASREGVLGKAGRL